MTSAMFSPGNSENGAEVIPPNRIVVRVHLIVVVPIGHESAARLAQCLPPENIVGGVHDTAAIKVAGYAGQHINMLLGPRDGRTIERGHRRVRCAEQDEHRIGVQ